MAAGRKHRGRNRGQEPRGAQWPSPTHIPYERRAGEPPPTGRGALSWGGETENTETAWAPSGPYVTDMVKGTRAPRSLELGADSR